MYAPPAFAIDDPEAFAAIIAAAPMATLVVAGPGGLRAAHLPMLYAPDVGLLTGHLARANPVAGLDDIPALAIFTAASAYVSPSFYASKREHGRVVPTWNYEAVHVHGRLERFDDPATLLQVVGALTDHFERDRPAPWAVQDAPARYIDGLLRAIVGVRFHVERIEGVRKLSQNKDAADRAGVRTGLSLSEHPGDRAVATLMESLQDD